MRKIEEVYTRGTTLNTKASVIENQSPLVYIMNFKNKQGYAIVSADTRMQPIIAVVDEGYLGQNDTIDNPCVKMMLPIADTDYRMSVGLPIRNSKNDCFVPVSQNEAGDFLYASSVEGDEVPPIDTTTLAGKFVYAQWTKYKVLGEEIDCKWGQRYPYNIYTKTASGENAPVGCVATAVAQILYYWGVNFTMNGVSFDWNLMRKHKSNTNSYSKAYDMVAKLFYELGLKKNLDMKYTENASGAPNENTYRTFKACGLSSGGVMEDYKWDRILDVIGERPIYICGYSNYTTELDENGNEKVIKIQNGHAWVVDKVKFRKRPKIKYNEKGVGKVVGYQHERLVHCNFGWNGACDGYYYSGKFDTKSGPVTKSTIDYGEDYFYQFYLTINCGIYK